MKTFDFIILGAGASAFAAAIKAHELGAKTAMVKGPLPLGGTCVNVGCVPSKALVRAAEIAHLAKSKSIPGLDLDLKSFDFKAIIQHEQEIVSKLRQKKYEHVVEALTNVTVFDGAAEFLDERRVRVDQEELQADTFLIATGSTARLPDIPGLAEADPLTHIEALNYDRFPKSLVVLGGGPVGLEFAQIFARFGSKVTLVTKDRLLFPRTEPELSVRLEKVFQDEGIVVLKETEATKVINGHQPKTVRVRQAGNEFDVEGEAILVATGKIPNTSTLGLEKAGVTVNDHQAIQVDQQYRTNRDHIFATGDVAALPQRLETTAGREGSYATENALRGTDKTIDYQTVPWTVFTDPQLAGVGLLDAEVGKHGLSCTCNTLDFEHVAKAQILGDTRGISKMIMDRDSRKIVGVHILGPSAGDTISQAELILKNEMTVDQVLDTLPVFPTLAESLKINALSLVTDVSKISCCI